MSYSKADLANLGDIFPPGSFLEIALELLLFIHIAEL